MHFRVESLEEEAEAASKKTYTLGTVRVETGHVMKAIFFAPTKVTENSFYYGGKGL